MSTQFNGSKCAAVLAVIAALIPSSIRAAEISTTVTPQGWTFINFDPAIPAGSAGSNANGINNLGQVVGVTVDVNNAPTSSNFTGTPAHTIPLNLGANAVAFGTNAEANVVGTQNGTAFLYERLNPSSAPMPILVPAGATNAFGINDFGQIVGQYTNAQGQTPGFMILNPKTHQYITIKAPSGPNTVNAQAVSNFGLIIGFYVGTDGQTHGFKANAAEAHNGVVTGTAIADPVIPKIAGEPGATFVFSQLLGVNDRGIVVGYYGDSTTSQHGFIYDSNTGKYTFLDDPKVAFKAGVEVTQITGISNSGELAGFYTDAHGDAHSFTACPAYAFCPNYPYESR
jgi:hypothetical protein